MGGGGSWNPVEIVENTFSSVGDALASVDPGPAIGGALAEVDDFVNDEIPGGWILPAAVAVAVTTGYVDPTLLSSEAAFTGATETGLATLAGEGAVADTIGTTLLAGGLGEGAGSGFVGLSPEFAAELGLEGGSALGLEGAAGDPLAALEGLDELANIQYPGDSQYEIQDLQEQARATDVKPGSPTSWDTGESLIPQELKDAASALNKARQVYGLGNALLGGSGGGTRMASGYLPYGFGISDLSGGTTGGSDLIKNLTPGLTAAKQDYILSGMPDINDLVSPIRFQTGGSTTTATPEYDPFSTDTTIGKSSLKPSLTKAQINYILTGLPGNLIGKAEGGAIQEHNPEFFSEGGLGSIQNRYVKGEGDGTSDSIPAMLANGEFVIPADVVSSLGNGSNDSGAKILDEFLSTIRKHKRVADAKKLPPDSKGPLAYLLDAKRKVKA